MGDKVGDLSQHQLEDELKKKFNTQLVGEKKKFGKEHENLNKAKEKIKHYSNSGGVSLPNKHKY